MISASSVLFTLVLFSELSSRLATVASPVTKVEDGEMEQDGLGSLLDDDSLSEHGVVPPLYRRNLVLDNNISDEDGNPRIIFVSVGDTRSREIWRCWLEWLDGLSNAAFYLIPITKYWIAVVLIHENKKCLLMLYRPSCQPKLLR